MDQNSLNPLIAQLRSDEQLLWTGKPNPECYFAQKKREAIPLFVGGALFLWLSSLVSFAVNGFSYLTLPLVFMGFSSLLAVKLVGTKRVSPRWWYAVTDKRVLSDYPTENTEAIWQLPLTHIHKMSIRKHGQNVATIQFNSSLLSQNCVDFECVDNAENVYKTIEDARNSLIFNSTVHI